MGSNIPSGNRFPDECCVHTFSMPPKNELVSWEIHSEPFIAGLRTTPLTKRTPINKQVVVETLLPTSFTDIIMFIARRSAVISSDLTEQAERRLELVGYEAYFRTAFLDVSDEEKEVLVRGLMSQTEDFQDAAIVCGFDAFVEAAAEYHGNAVNQFDGLFENARIFAHFAVLAEIDAKVC
ncbi:MAG: hypothetical protein AAB624_02710 [Patescibacteria group bacterium]